MTAGRRVWIRFPIGVLHLLHHCSTGVEWADGNLIPSDPSNHVPLCLNGTKQKGAVNALLIPPIFHLDSLLVFELQLLRWRLKGQVLLFFFFWLLFFFFWEPIWLTTSWTCSLPNFTSSHEYFGLLKKIIIGLGSLPEHIIFM